MPVGFSLSSRASRSDRTEVDNHQRTRSGRCRHHPHARHIETSPCDHPNRRGGEITHNRQDRFAHRLERGPAAAAARLAAPPFRVRIDCDRALGSIFASQMPLLAHKSKGAMVLSRFASWVRSVLSFRPPPSNALSRSPLRQPSPAARPSLSERSSLARCTEAWPVIAAMIGGISVSRFRTKSSQSRAAPPRPDGDEPARIWLRFLPCRGPL
jgi:hypothetical protein